MYYEEPYRKKNRVNRSSRRRRSFGGWLIGLCLRLIALLLALLLLGAALLYALPPTLFEVEPGGVELSLTDGLPGSRANILLLGLDVLRERSQRSDSVIIASTGYGELRLASVMRDTLMDIPGRGTSKLNAAYAYGGPELVMRTLNENLGLNIMHYVAVDFSSLVAVVDAIGGVDVEVAEAEVSLINQMLERDRARIEAKGYATTALPQGGGRTHLNGLQALYFARIRKLDSDYSRTRRQRALLSAMLSRIRANLWNPVLLARLGRTLLDATETNMTVVQLMSLGMKALSAGTPEQLRLPVDGSFTDDGSSLRIDDRQMNIDAFRTFAY